MIVRGVFIFQIYASNISFRNLARYFNTLNKFKIL